ncbi:hypothetical protein CKO51_20815 [Rhodopirellula sp. SM50]|nr:hypothetical protein CKO51_20815 [Rhodopirellula sp. SM50]
MGEPIRHGVLSVFPLFIETSSEVPYRLSDEALADESIVVTEVSEQGSVADLLVENKGELRVLFLEGEELVGAKQNRVLNTSVLVAAHSKVKIPVSCVEQGRWRFKSRFFGASGSSTPSKLRRALKRSVSKSVKEARGHKSDQGEVWSEVAAFNCVHGVDSSTQAMADAFGTYEDKVKEYHDKLQYVDHASGIAIAIAGQVVSVDLFDKSSTCEKLWKRMLSGVVMDALAAEEPAETAAPPPVERLISTVGELDWQPSVAVGEGDEFRAESNAGDHASALALGGTVVHASVLTNVD